MVGSGGWLEVAYGFRFARGKRQPCQARVFLTKARTQATGPQYDAINPVTHHSHAKLHVKK